MSREAGRPSPARRGPSEADAGTPEVLVFPDAAKLAAAAAERAAAALVGAVEERGVAHFAVSGGSSPVALYRLLAGRTDIPWPSVHLWWIDDRFVPPDHPDSNVALVDETLLRADEETVRGADVPAGNVHPFPIQAGLEDGRDAAWVAATYAEEILRHVPSPDGRPVFDLMLLGVGRDGHVMSAFPGSPALAPDAPLALAVPAPREVGPHLPRVTLRASVADDAHVLLVLVPDGTKAAVVARALQGPPDPMTVPAVIARRAGATWFLTRESASLLREARPASERRAGPS